MVTRNNQAKIEKNQLKVDAGFMSKQYPEVESIVISMIYNQKGIAKPLERIVNFSSDSYAFFKIDCLSRDCVDGGFDLTRVINKMIRNNKKSAKGELGCDDSGPQAKHSDIEYEIQIKFS